MEASSGIACQGAGKRPAALPEHLSQPTAEADGVPQHETAAESVSQHTAEVDTCSNYTAEMEDFAQHTAGDNLAHCGTAQVTIPARNCSCMGTDSLADASSPAAKEAASLGNDAASLGCSAAPDTSCLLTGGVGLANPSAAAKTQPDASDAVRSTGAENELDATKVLRETGRQIDLDITVSHCKDSSSGRWAQVKTA